MLDKPGKISFIDRQKGVKIKEEKDENYTPGSKKARIIVRNLPFKNLSEKKLSQWFSEYGDIDEVKLLKKDDGKFVGCGFVQFKKVASAAKAVAKANQKEISGRKIIVDWAVPKKVYLETLQNLQIHIKKEPKDDSDGSGSECSGTGLPYKIDRNPSTEFDEDECKTNESEEESDDEDTETEDIKPFHSKNRAQHGESKEKPKVKSNDVEEGRTIFVRNIPFSASNDDLKACFSKFGALEYALVCMDKLTEHSKGTGFVKFKEKSCAEECLRQKNNIFLEDNALLISLAVSKENLENMKKKKEGKDSRNLYLAREGVITTGSPAARGVSAADMAKRLEIERWKTQMLKNLNMFISDKRLIVHNLPASYDDSKLKALFKKHSQPGAVVTEARVMRDKKKVDERTGLGVSKEYGFVAFSDHKDALFALRSINNNPEIFSVKRRPIVAFSVESRAALNVKRKRMERSRAKLGVDADDKSGNLKKLNRKQRRFIVRRQKFIERRRQAKKMKMEPSAEEVNPKKRKIS